MLFTIRLGGLQFTRFGVAMKECVLNIKGSGSGDGVGQIKSFEALATALSSCVGIGNIVGVSSAIALGGPGAVFWMLVAGLIGMATKFAEICLAMLSLKTLRISLSFMILKTNNKSEKFFCKKIYRPPGLDEFLILLEIGIFYLFLLMASRTCST